MQALQSAPPRGRLARLTGSSIGAKTVMSVSGLLLFGFVTAHLAGNLLILRGRDALNTYAAWMHKNPELVWPARLGLLTVFVVHIVTALRLARLNRTARPEPYAFQATVQASWASRHMVLSGLVLLAFIVYHLLHFTFNAVPLGEIEMVNGQLDVYGMVVRSFSHPLVALIYIGSQAILGLHLWHGSRSLFQSVGVDAPSIIRLLRLGAIALTLVVAAGNILLPLSVLLGLVGKA